MLKKILLINLLVVMSLSATAQQCYTVKRDVKSDEEFDILLDSLCREAVVDSTESSVLALRLKFDSLYHLMSVHVSYSRNMDSSFFYKICTTLEDCYTYYILFNGWYELRNKYISKEHMYIIHAYRYYPD